MYGFRYGYHARQRSVRGWGAVKLLFALGEPGVAYDAFDLSSLYQDAAGTSPATDAGQIALVLDRIHATHARQSSVSLRPLLGRAPKDRRNLLRATAALTAAVWVKESCSVASLGGGVFKISEIAGNPAGSPFYGHALLFNGAPIPGFDNRILTIEARAAERSRMSIHGRSATAWGCETVDLMTGATIAGATGGNIAVTILSTTPIGEGWWRIIARVRMIWGVGGTIALSPSLGDGVSGINYTGDGVSGIEVRAPQLEANASTTYQEVDATGTVTTEPGVPSYHYARFDLADDRLDTVLPQAVTGDVVIAGRDGTVIAPASYAAGSTFQLGPTSYTGGVSGILRAVGDVVGWTVIGRTLTAAERKWLLDYYKERGAKGLLVPGGPELIVNGGFDADTGWSKWAGWTIEGGVATFTPGTSAFLNQAHPGAANKPHLATITVLQGTIVFLGSQYREQISLGVGTHTVCVVPAYDALVLWASTLTTIDNYSVKELRPEEEW